jgi:metal-responsive CopG/Arc/MetJ family transcriptional regulator
MPRHEEFPIKLQLSVTDDLDEAIKKWRQKQDDVPNRSEAIRRLLWQALDQREPRRMKAKSA